MKHGRPPSGRGTGEITKRTSRIAVGGLSENPNIKNIDLGVAGHQMFA
jgi:hypothetical protein